ncbi:unnamed protein product [Cylindrotheca closterium]|uniref:Uncharacterized protein n=1 Tax=Cylindrotheca closterium TaxID=2856 RepID=A0AAD2JK72_9STRA|nr:unnamed protein product [Cylindrotheca closterium]
MQDLYGVAWFRNFAVKTKAYAAIASTDTTARDKFKDDIFEAVIATGFLCNCDRTRTAPLMLDLQTNYCREVDYYPKTISKAQDMLKIHMDVIKNLGVNLYQGKDQPNKGKGKLKDDKNHMSPKCSDRLLPEIQWKHPKHYVDYGKKLNLNQIGATVPAIVPGPSPATSIITGGTSSVAGSINTPLRLAGTTGNQMMQVSAGMQLMQIPTQGGRTMTVPYTMNYNGETAFSGMQLSQQGFSGAQVRQGFDATPAQTPQVVKTGYFDTSNVFHDAIKGKDEIGNDPSSVLDLWHHFGSVAGSGFHGWVPEFITIEGSEDRLVQALLAGTLRVVSDGSYKAKVGTACAQILTEDRRDIIWITCQTPGKFEDQSSTRSELIGLMASLLVLEWMSQVAQLKLFASQPSVEMACDGLIAIDKSFSEVHLSSSGAQFDLASTIRALLRHLPLQVQRRHVKGHLDKHRPFSQLDWWEQRNVEVDSKTQAHCRLLESTGRSAASNPRFFHEPVSSFINGVKSSKLDQAHIMELVSLPAL